MNYPVTNNYEQPQASNREVAVTLKADTAYDAPWITVRDSTAEGTADLVGAAEASGLFALVGKADAAFKAEYQAGKGLGATPVQSPAAAVQQYQQGPPQGGYQQQTQQQAPPQQGYQQSAPQAPPGPEPTCPHGTKKFKTAPPNSGKSWKAWMCPSPQGTPDQCKPQWIQ